MLTRYNIWYHYIRQYERLLCRFWHLVHPCSSLFYAANTLDAKLADDALECKGSVGSISCPTKDNNSDISWSITQDDLKGPVGYLAIDFSQGYQLSSISFELHDDFSSSQDIDIYTQTNEQWIRSQVSTLLAFFPLAFYKFLQYLNRLNMLYG